RRRFARAVRADQAEDLAAVKIEAEVLHGGQAAEALGQPAHLQERCGAVRSNGRRRHERAPRASSEPRKPFGKNRMTNSATAETMKVAISPVGRKNSPATIRKMAPSAAPITVRRPPSTAATITCTPTAISTTVPTEAVPM